MGKVKRKAMGFAKLFGEGAGQILCVRRDNEDGEPVVEITVAAGSGMTTLTHVFKSDAKRNELFASIDAEVAERHVKPARQSLHMLLAK